MNRRVRQTINQMPKRINPNAITEKDFVKIQDQFLPVRYFTRSICSFIPGLRVKHEREINGKSQDSRVGLI